MDASENKYEIRGKCWNVVLEKHGDQLRHVIEGKREGRTEVTERPGRGWNTRSHSVENSLWKRLWTCGADNRRNEYLQNLWFSERCCWGLRSFGMWRRIVGREVSYVSEECSASIFRVKHINKNEPAIETSVVTASRPRKPDLFVCGHCNNAVGNSNRV